MVTLPIYALLIIENKKNTINNKNFKKYQNLTLFHLLFNISMDYLTTHTSL